MPGRQIIERVTTQVTTTNNTQTVLASWPIPTGCSISAECMVIGRNAATGDTVVAKQIVAAKNQAGVASLTGSVVNVITTLIDTLMIGASVTMDTSGTNLRVLVTGRVATTIDWQCDLEVQQN